MLSLPPSQGLTAALALDAVSAQTKPHCRQTVHHGACSLQYPILCVSMYLSSWASQPRAGRRRYLSSSQSPWSPAVRSSSRVSYTFLGAIGIETPA